MQIMTNYLPVMLSVQHPHPELETWVAARFAALNGCDVFIVNQDNLPPNALRGNPAYAKAWLWDVVPSSTTHIIFMDYDIVPIRALPIVPDVAFAAVTDNAAWLRYVNATYPVFTKSKKYFNSGFFVARRDTRPCFEQLKAFVVSSAHGKGPSKDNTYDQTILNQLIQGSFDVHWLSHGFNCMGHTGYVEASEAYMLHMAGFPDQARWALMHMLKDALGLLPVQLCANQIK